MLAAATGDHAVCSTSRFLCARPCKGVIREGVIAACLTALMILLFLGSWRSTLIIAVSIPLSVLISIMVLSALHETINIMTLGGWRWPSASSWTTPRSRSKISRETSRKGKTR